MRNILKTLLDIIKENRRLAEAKAILAKMPMCVEALHIMVNEVTNKNVKIEITQTDGTNIIIEPLDNKQLNFVSFKDQYNSKRGK